MSFLANLFKRKPVVNPIPVRTQVDFDALVRQSPYPVIVDVWSESCPPCKQLVPVLRTLVTEYHEKIRVVEIASDSELALMKALKIYATPTLIIYNNGEELGREVGARPLSWFRSMIKAEFSY